MFKKGVVYEFFDVTEVKEEVVVPKPVLVTSGKVILFKDGFVELDNDLVLPLSSFKFVREVKQVDKDAVQD